ncbi:putative ABC transporter permease [Listeria fleischmannii 1991]|jgi:D-methionine transport system permease protein|uniref:Methionine import system permease protein MetP n=4 Tax=Listeria fleischmannii TaxID=1069827 RepID=A0A2X3HIX2_9LIST|nr:methionine ABC transporter permease [Listeria fleischmannii]EIA21594.1 ABC transporter, permease protein [Listeria fleischmannii subsp. coloradonensis]EMG26882.1 putative ABC transporter permease [Listeria fleischmannii subsp. fleischmannii LU2006-1]EUJ52266.1 putative ABC transporter permease [Listeria fleischmannii FSL S10-1203]KMT59178.1 putative ABC transporter permease [Listeria fleischmannii 1991]MBC1398728.1 ABC transporter permease [Listeria fleischmannii]
MKEIFPDVDWQLMWSYTEETLYMTLYSLVAVFVLGILLGLLLFLTNRKEGLPAKILYWITAILVNVFRSIPFIILIVLLLPMTKTLVGTIIGPKAALPALIISAAPFYARMVEIAFREVDKGVIEAAKSMGANLFTIIGKVLIPEALPAIVSGITVTAISLVGFTAMAGVIGAGGLGNAAYLEGFQRNQPDVTIVATIIILIIVFIFQIIGDLLTKAVDKR